MQLCCYRQCSSVVKIQLYYQRLYKHRHLRPEPGDGAEAWVATVGLGVTGQLARVFVTGRVIIVIARRKAVSTERRQELQRRDDELHDDEAVSA